MADKGPKSVEELYERMKKQAVPDEDIEAFKQHILDEQHDLRSIREDVEDRDQSLFVDFFEENCTLKDKLFDIVVSILDDKDKEPPKPKPATPPPPKKQPTPPPKEPTPPPKQKPEPEPAPEAVSRSGDKRMGPTFLHEFQQRYPNLNITGYVAAHDDQWQGTVILNAALIKIPDEVIINEKYLEDVQGITYILEYNNIVVRPPSLPLSYIEFWHEYVREEHPQFTSIRKDIRHNEGAVYDYLMENPPNDRILPVLEKVVDQLRYPVLESKKKRKARKDGYEKETELFFHKNMPDWYQQEMAAASDSVAIRPFRETELFKTCVLFMKNTEEVNFNIFELFPVVVDIYDRILYKPERYGLPAEIKKPYQVTGIDNKRETKTHLRSIHHFGAELEFDDWRFMNTALVRFKERDPQKRSFFAKLVSENELKEQEDQKIADSLGEFQNISLSFLMFVKAFMCETGNGLETGYHVYKVPKGGKKNHIYKADIETILRQKKKLNMDKVTEEHITFHNENFPLQVDLVVIPKNAGNTEEYKDYAFDIAQSSMKYEPEGAYKTFVKPLKSQMFTTGISGAQDLYALMVETFRAMVFHTQNLKIPDPTDEQSNMPQQIASSGAKKTQRRDDRYVMVIDRVSMKLYFYPPHIYQGTENDTIVHRKVIAKDLTSARRAEDDGKEEQNADPQQQANSAATDKDSTEANAVKPDEEEKKDENVIKDVPVRNRYSYIPHEYNDLTNWYLTSRCLVPSKGKLSGDANRNCYGVRDFAFVLSAHFHKQRQWHRHPKLRIYQYFNGGGMRFMHVACDRQQHKAKDDIVYKYDQDMTEIWKAYFSDHSKSLQATDIDRYKVFDAIFDLYQCDAQFFQWDNAVKRSVKKNKTELTDVQ
eukprot:CAMPEP_0197033182 /NCGR_PEP_ID=MMETSP1384-20130603/11658_1 /TAXON_ID=29189 /ORGANISM="Ammonia sp." /LENGTH=878 /DNA_ID=CAMNT_0042462957 /DNA_START=300 /DNA_END=2936 /DNA_ORIENTATION=+